MKRRMFKHHEPKHLKAKKRFRLPASAVLVYLLVAAAMTTGVSFSRYTTTVSGSDSARVAKWEVSAVAAVGNSDTFELTSERDAAWKLTVTSSSEVTVEYDVVVNIPTALAGKLICTLDGKQAATVSTDKYIFADAGTIPADAENKTNTHTLTIMGTDFTEGVAAKEITVGVIARQVD